VEGRDGERQGGIAIDVFQEVAQNCIAFGDDEAELREFVKVAQ